jgi:hypothetical protein
MMANCANEKFERKTRIQGSRIFIGKVLLIALAKIYPKEPCNKLLIQIVFLLKV